MDTVQVMAMFVTSDPLGYKPTVSEQMANDILLVIMEGVRNNSVKLDRNHQGMIR